MDTHPSDRRTAGGPCTFIRRSKDTGRRCRCRRRGRDRGCRRLAKAVDLSGTIALPRVVAVEDRPDPGITVEVALEMLLAPAALVAQRRIVRVWTGVDPFAQMMPVGTGKGRLQQPPVFR